MGVKKECCVIVYNSFLDPLNQNLMMQYIKTVHKNSGWKFHLITFEQPHYNISREDKQSIKDQLLKDGICWYPRRHHTGKLLLVKKMYDFLSLAVLLFRLRIKGVKLLWSFANVAASIAWVYGKLFHFKTLVYSYEPHSQFMIELGIWRSNSMKFKILNYLEQRAGLQGDFILTGTKHMVKELIQRKAKGEIHRAPTAVDENEFYYRPEGRGIICERHNFDVKDNIVLYIGKFGDLYYTWQIPLLFKHIEETIPNTRFIVISPNSYDDIKRYCEQTNWHVSKITYLTKLPYEDVKFYMSGANLGISAVPPTPSQKFRSPTKVAEYLLCGLPYITCAGISEDDEIAKQYNVGVVLDDFSEKSIQLAIPQVRAFVLGEKGEIAERCRTVGLTYRSKQRIDLILSKIFKKLSD